ncbi:hypothetical protein [Pseudomonas sp. 34 E 7]|nr:hypothetical protein [Pseudomonas sp. 34 E 7]
MGGGLPSMAVYQVSHCWLTHCYRGQAPSHIDGIPLPSTGLHDNLTHRLALPQVIDRLGRLFQLVHL